MARGVKNYEIVRGFGTPSVAPRGYLLRRDDVDYVVFCFAEPADADAFCRRFGGEMVQSK